jgi:hypothetical protein
MLAYADVAGGSQSKLKSMLSADKTEVRQVEKYQSGKVFSKKKIERKSRKRIKCVRSRSTSPRQGI